MCDNAAIKRCPAQYRKKKKEIKQSVFLRKPPAASQPTTCLVLCLQISRYGLRFSRSQFSGRCFVVTEFLFINLESQLRLAAEVTGNSLSALLDSHPYHVHTHICLCLRTLGVYIMIVNLTFSHCFNVFEGPVFILTQCHSARGIWVQ